MQAKRRQVVSLRVSFDLASSAACISPQRAPSETHAGTQNNAPNHDSRLTAHDSHVPQTNVKYESVVYIFTIISKNSNNNNIFSNSNNVNREWLNSHPTGLCNADHGLSN